MEKGQSKPRVMYVMMATGVATMAAHTPGRTGVVAVSIPHA